MDGLSDRSTMAACLAFLQSTLIFSRSSYLRSEDCVQGTSQEREVLEQKMTVEGCARLFNESPGKGVRLVIQSHLTDCSLAQFLRRCNLLDPAKLSEFLAQPSQVELLNEYLATFEFTNLTLDVGLRELCTSFRLPGESQQIDRVMQAFARQYHHDNAAVSEDAAYVISFSIIMLHTDRHNPNIVKKMTCEDGSRTREM
jgi:Sec7-like guanine-nucleotide exchange factor